MGRVSFSKEEEHLLLRVWRKGRRMDEDIKEFGGVEERNQASSHCIASVFHK